MMARAQVSLDPELHRQARERAAQLGVSFAEYVRKLVREDLEEPSPQGSPSLVLKLGRSASPTDVGRDKNRMIGEAIEAEFLGSRAVD